MTPPLWDHIVILFSRLHILQNVVHILMKDSVIKHFTTFYLTAIQYLVCVGRIVPPRKDSLSDIK